MLFTGEARPSPRGCVTLAAQVPSAVAQRLPVLGARRSPHGANCPLLQQRGRPFAAGTSPVGCYEVAGTVLSRPGPGRPGAWPNAQCASPQQALSSPPPDWTPRQLLRAPPASPCASLQAPRPAGSLSAVPCPPASPPFRPPAPCRSMSLSIWPRTPSTRRHPDNGQPLAAQAPAQAQEARRRR